MVAADHKWKQNNLGFLTDTHQVNVAITRAKYGLIIIGKYTCVYRFTCSHHWSTTGNATLLKYDSTWRKIIKIYKEKGCLKKVGPHTED